MENLFSELVLRTNDFEEIRIDPIIIQRTTYFLDHLHSKEIPEVFPTFAGTIQAEYESGEGAEYKYLEFEFRKYDIHMYKVINDTEEENCFRIDNVKRSTGKLSSFCDPAIYEDIFRFLVSCFETIIHTYLYAHCVKTAHFFGGSCNKCVTT